MKRSLLVLSLCMLHTTVSLADFPFPNGKYVGQSQCTDAQGNTTTTDVTLLIKENILSTTLPGPEGEIVSTKKAHFSPDGSFTLTGTGVVDGYGSCSSETECSYKATLQIPVPAPKGCPTSVTVRGEDKIQMKDGELILVGHATSEDWVCQGYDTFPGSTQVCREVYRKDHQ